MIHNETMNIWTHLLSALYFIYHLVLILCGYKMYSSLKFKSSYALLAIGNCSSVCCLVFSSIYHSFNVISPDIYKFLLKLDLFGICIMIFTLSITITFSGFHNF